MDTILTADLRKKIIIGIVFLALVLLAIITVPGILQSKQLISFKTVMIVTRVLFWLCLLLMFVYALKIERQPFLLWTETKQRVDFYILSNMALIGILFIGTAFIGITLTKILHINQPNEKFKLLVPLFRANKGLLILTIVTAGVVEEFLFRGYLMPRLELLLKSTNWAIFISSALFGLMHFSYGTIAQVIGPFYIGLIFAIFYKKYRNIQALIICHILWDGFSILTLIAISK